MLLRRLDTIPERDVDIRTDGERLNFCATVYNGSLDGDNDDKGLTAELCGCGTETSTQ